MKTISRLIINYSGQYNYLIYGDVYYLNTIKII